MKTYEQITKEIQKLTALDQRTTEDKELKAARKRAQFLSQVKKYLETQPREEFVRKELHRLADKIEIVKDAFSLPQDLKVKEATKLRKEFEKTHEVPKMKAQLKTLQYILA